jgi:hypothetical protein
MNFIRGLDPKEAMGVGQTACAPVITMMYSLNPTNMVAGPDGKVGPAHSNMSGDATHRVLKSIQEKTNDVRTRFFAFTTDTEGYQGRISKFKGQYLKYETVLYHIPKDAV